MYIEQKKSTQSIMCCLCTDNRTWVESVFPKVSSAKVCYHRAPDPNNYTCFWVSMHNFFQKYPVTTANVFCLIPQKKQSRAFGKSQETVMY